ncbi:sugar isomerase domain-containing protein [Sciscionella marina]|uniref:sugar isomerase domain-containing protein n=1 Tax=Sciscionella marina TaxID=508770 RepID=UPI00036A962B|nr:SIS domain-containing protein [Sciscionella marina]
MGQPAGASEVGAGAFLTRARELLDQVAERNVEAVAEAATMITHALRSGGIVQAFGTGHSEGLAMEIAGRAGGLVPTNKVALRDLVVLGGEPAQVLFDAKLERDPEVAHRLYTLTDPRPDDLFVIASNSGVNGCIVEMAKLVKDKGHALIAVNSRAHSEGVPSRHPSGNKLGDYADLVLDNGAPYGDAILRMADGGSVCAISSMSGALLVQLTIAEVVRAFALDGEPAPVYRSANIPDGDEHNKTLEARYAGRIRRSA